MTLAQAVAALEDIKRRGSDEAVRVTVHGNSMLPRIKSGSTVIVKPASAADVDIDDVVIAKVRGRVYCHFVRGKMGRGPDGSRVKIANASGRVNGWTSNVFGVVVGIEEVRR